MFLWHIGKFFIDFFKIGAIIVKSTLKKLHISGCGAVLVARLNGVQEAAGSTPVTRTTQP